MADRANQSMISWLDIDLSNLSPHEKTQLIEEILPGLPSTELRLVRDSAEAYRLGKLEETKQMVLDRMRDELESAGINPDEIQVRFGRPRASAKPKYRSPDGKRTWTGQGFEPRWLTDLVAQGHDKEEYRIEETAQ